MIREYIVTLDDEEAGFRKNAEILDLDFCAEEIRQAEWILTKRRRWFAWNCSNCHNDSDDTFDFCPYCRARMKKEIQDGMVKKYEQPSKD